MTASEATAREVVFLKSNDSTRREYGITYRDILNAWRQSATPWLSEEFDLHSIAREIFLDAKRDFEKTRDSKHKLRMSAASDFFVNDELSRSATHQLLKEYEVRSLEDARVKLASHPAYRRLNPRVVEELLRETQAHSN